MRRRIAWAGIGLLAAVMVGVLAPLPAQERWVLAILTGAMVLWIAEVLPLGVTALAAATALVVLAGFRPKPVFASFFDPVVVLMLGGFLLGVALQRTGLDQSLAGLTLQRLGRDPRIVLLGLMAIAGTFSMWVSNTATTAIVLPIAVTLAADGPASRGRAYVLGVAAAANIGGIGTPIGTPANAIALRFLADQGDPITFLDWMLRAVPLAFVILLCAWVLLTRIHPLGAAQVPEPRPRPSFSATHWRLVILFAATVLLWMTSDLHGFDPAVVAAGCAVALFALRILGEKDLGLVSWDTLLLIGGSIALGEAVQMTGLDDRLATSLDGLGEQGPLVAITGLAVVAVALTFVSSNTGAAVLLVPLSILWAASWGLPVQVLAMTAAVAVSFDFLVPMGTPPNAMARSTGLVDLRGMLRSGAPITLVATGLLVVAARWFW